MSRKASQTFSSLSKLMDHIADPNQSKARGKGLRDSLNVRSKLYENSKNPVRYPGDPDMKTLKVRSNYARSRTVMLDSLVLKFDDHGVASFPAHLLPILEKEMAVKPGRYFLVQDTPQTQETVPVESGSIAPPTSVVRDEVFSALERIAAKLKAEPAAEEEQVDEVEDEDDDWDLPIEEMEI